MPVAELRGLNFHYYIHGSGFPVVLAHGYCASISMWEHQIPALAQRYQVIAYDARGHGLSSAPYGKQHYTLQTLVDDLHALLTHLDIGKAYLVGHSMGGATVAAYAAQYPDQVNATLICNIDAGHQVYTEEALLAAQQDRRRSHALVHEHGLVDYARRQIATGAAPAFIRTDDTKQHAYLERYARQPENGFFGVGESLPWREPSLKEATAGLTGPVAIIAGTEDVMHSGALAVHERLSQSRFVSIENAPHDSMNARPEAFNQAMLEFLDALEAHTETAGRLSL